MLFLNDEVKAGCPKLGHTTLYYSHLSEDFSSLHVGVLWESRFFVKIFCANCRQIYNFIMYFFNLTGVLFLSVNLTIFER